MISSGPLLDGVNSYTTGGFVNFSNAGGSPISLWNKKDVVQ